MMRLIYSHSEAHYYFHGNRLWCSEHGTLQSSQEQNGKGPCSDSLSLWILGVVTLGGSQVPTELSPKDLAYSRSFSVWSSNPRLVACQSQGPMGLWSFSPSSIVLDLFIINLHVSVLLPLLAPLLTIPSSLVYFSLLFSLNLMKSSLF